MASKKDPYARLAEQYDSMTVDPAVQAFYGEWRDSLLRAAGRLKIDVRVLVDLACGTGNTAIPWTKRGGWTVIGVDRSPWMLRQARKKSRRVRWYCQRLESLALEEHADAVTCHFDALNHILVPRDLERVFLNVARILNEGGLFQFDLNTKHWFRWLSAQEKLFRVGKNYLMTRNEYEAKRHIVTFHHIWFIKKGRQYRKCELEVQERDYSTSEIRQMAKKAGLRLIRVEAQRRIDGRPIRLVYLFRKPRQERRPAGPHSS